MKLWLIGGAVLGFALWTGAVFLYGDNHGTNRTKAELQDETIKAVEAARRQEQAQQKEINDAAQAQYNEMATINAQLANDIKRLHKRKNRRHVPESPSARCEGANGSELSINDAEFLTRLAAKAERQRQALKACYKYADIVAGAP